MLKGNVVLVKKILLYGVLALIVPIMIYLNYYSFFYSICQYDIPYGATMLETKDSIVLHCISGCGFLILPATVTHLLRKVIKEEQLARLFVFGAMGISFLFCLTWVLNGNFFAQNDSRGVLECMERMRNGDFSDLLPKGYIGAYKQHLGLITIFNLIFTIARTTDNIVIQIVNCVCISVLIYAGYGILKEFSASILVYAYYGAFMTFCFPLFFYAPYVYGEIISVTAGMIFIWAAICYIKRGKNSSWGVLAVCSVVGYMARGNFPVLLIAFAILAVLYSVRRKNIKLFICALSLFVIMLGANSLNIKYYEKISGIKIDQGVPVEGWIAMGLDEECELANGMYNGANIDTYASCGYDRKEAQAQFRKYIHDRLLMFVNGAGTGPYAFYKEKMLSQWNDPTFNCFMENRTFIPAANPIIENIVYADGKYGDLAREILNQYHWLLYLGALLYCLLLFRKNIPFYQTLIIIILIGGFLFTMIWEAMSRYVLPYAIYMIPVASIGWYKTLDICKVVLKKCVSNKR